LCKDDFNITHMGMTQQISQQLVILIITLLMSHPACVCDMVIWGRGMFSLSMMPHNLRGGTPAHFSISRSYIQHVT